MKSLETLDKGQGKRFGDSPNVMIQNIIIVFLVSLPILSILGTQLFPFFENNPVLLLLISLLALVPVLVAFDKIPKKLYNLAIVIIALSLLYSTSLNSTYLIGTDIHKEYYFSNLVKTNFYWDSTIASDYNAMLSIVMLAPMCSIVSGMSLIWVFKIIYPLLFSFTSLILYKVFKSQTDGKTAFLSVFFITSVFTFYTEMVGLARQQIGEVVFALLLLLISDKVMISNFHKKTILMLIFATILPMFHYALACIFIGLTFFVLFVSYFVRVQRKTITIPFVIFCCIVTIGWFIYTSRASTFNIIVKIINHIASTIFTNFLDPQSAQGLHILITRRKTPLHDITKTLHLVMQFFITIGVLVMTLGRVVKKFDEEHHYLSLGSFILLIAAIAIPYLASALNTTRLYHISLFLLAPYSVIGWLAIFKTMSKSTATSFKILSLFLSVFLLFNTGFIYTIANNDKSIAYPTWAVKNGEAKDWLVLYNAYTPIEEITSAKWLSDHRDGTLKIYADSNRAFNAYGMISTIEITKLWRINNEMNEVSYIYLRKLNTINGIMAVRTTPTGILFSSTADILFSLSEKTNLIYSGGESIIYVDYI